MLNGHKEKKKAFPDRQALSYQHSYTIHQVKARSTQTTFVSHTFSRHEEEQVNLSVSS